MGVCTFSNIGQRPRTSCGRRELCAPPNGQQIDRCAKWYRNGLPFLHSGSLSKGSQMSIGTILLIILILALVGVLPTWGHSRSWGYGPSGGIGLIVIILIILLVLGKI